MRGQALGDEWVVAVVVIEMNTREAGFAFGGVVVVVIIVVIIVPSPQQRRRFAAPAASYHRQSSIPPAGFRPASRRLSRTLPLRGFRFQADSRPAVL